MTDKPIVTIEIHMVPIDPTGYDDSGNYYGTGAPLFWVFGSGACNIDTTMRAEDRNALKCALRAKYRNFRLQFV